MTQLLLAIGYICFLMVVSGLGLFIWAATKREWKHSAQALLLLSIGLISLLGGKFKLFSNEYEAKSLLQYLQGQPGDLDKIADDNSALVGWGKLALYRVIIRSKLHSICQERSKPECLVNNPNMSFEQALSLNQDVLNQSPNAGLAEKIEKIRVYTHYAEWGSGIPPNNEQIEFVLDSAPATIVSLKSIEQKYR